MSMAQSIQEYRWKNRLIILVSDTPNSAKLNQQRQIFEQKQSQLEERDMILLNRQTQSPDLSRFALDTHFEGVLLIGKDGGIKLQKPFFVEPQEIFDLVDSMPMRRAEMRSKY